MSSHANGRLVISTRSKFHGTNAVSGINTKYHRKGPLSQPWWARRKASQGATVRQTASLECVAWQTEDLHQGGRQEDTPKGCSLTSKSSLCHVVPIPPHHTFLDKRNKQSERSLCGRATSSVGIGHLTKGFAQLSVVKHLIRTCPFTLLFTCKSSPPFTCKLTRMVSVFGKGYSRKIPKSVVLLDSKHPRWNYFVIGLYPEPPTLGPLSGPTCNTQCTFISWAKKRILFWI